MIAKQALSHSQHIGESSDHLNDLGSNHSADESGDGVKRDWVPSTKLVAIKEAVHLEQKSSNLVLQNPGTMGQELFWCRVALVNGFILESLVGHSGHLKKCK